MNRSEHSHNFPTGWCTVSEHTHRLGITTLSFSLLLSFFVIFVHVFPDDR